MQQIILNLSGYDIISAKLKMVMQSNSSMPRVDQYCLDSEFDLI